MVRISALASIALAVLCGHGTSQAQTILFSDAFDRVVGTPDENGEIDGMPNPLAASTWGDNDSALGGTITQTYEITPDIRPGNRHQYVDGDQGRFRAGFAEIQHDFGADSRTSAGGGISIQFDATIADLTNGWLGVSIGQTADESGDQADGSNIFMVTQDTVDFGVLFGGINGAGIPTILEIFEGDDNPDPFFVAASGDWGQGTNPNIEQSFQIDIATNTFGDAGTSALVDIFVTDPTFGQRQVLSDYSFEWDADGEVYISFASNKDQGCGADCEDPLQEVRIDNLVISTINTVAPMDNPGDFNADGKVDNGDLNLLLGNWGEAAVPAEWVNGFVSPVDNGELNALLGNWGFGVSSVAVPEPASVALVAAAIGFVARRRR